VKPAKVADKKTTAVGRLVLYKAFLATAASALTAPPAAVGVLLTVLASPGGTALRTARLECAGLVQETVTGN
jgi:hypothetical protein